MSTTPYGRMQLANLPLAELIRFGDRLFIEDPEIEAQHQEIFKLGCNVYENWRGGGSLDVLRPAVEKLSNLIHTHFSFEERILSGIGYEDLRSHAAEHRRMRDELSIMNEQFNVITNGEKAGSPSLLDPGWSIMQFVLGFSIGHVASCDMAYNQALIASRDQARTSA